MVLSTLKLKLLKLTIMIKHFKIYLAGFAGLLSLGFLLSSCEKTFDEKTAQQQDFSNSTIAQVVVATMNAAGNHVTVDSRQVTGSALATGSVFPTTGYGFVVNPGMRAFLVTGSGTQAQLSFAQNMQAGKHYTIFLYDTISAPKQKTVLDDIVVPADTTIRLRLANFIYSPNAIPNIDVYSWLKQANIFTNVAVTDVTPFITYPSFITDTLYFRETGTTNTFIKATYSGGFTAKRSYTLLLRGSYRAGTRPIQTVISR